MNRALWSVAALISAWLVVLTGSAGAATIEPTTPLDEYADPGPGAGCSLRESIEAANTDGVFGGCSEANEGPDTILLTPGATYLRSRTGNDQFNQVGDLDVAGEDLAIVVDGGGGAVIQGDGTAAGGRVIDIVSAPPINVAVAGVTITNGVPEDGFGGGGMHVLAFNSTITVSNSTITGNVAPDGGGIGQSGSTLRLNNVTVSGNDASNSGGGVDNVGGATLVNNITVTDNTADSDANGSGNGGGLRGSSFIGLVNSVVAGNHDLTPDFFLRARDCTGTLSSQGYNLIGTTANCDFDAAPGDLINLAPGLGPLASNGGPTQTHALLAGSPAVDAGNPAVPGSGDGACLVDDQRGTARPQGTRCDIGAFEAPPPAPSGTAAPASLATENPECAALRSKLRRAKTKQKKRKLRRRLRALGC